MDPSTTSHYDEYLATKEAWLAAFRDPNATADAKQAAQDAYKQAVGKCLAEWLERQ